MFDEKDLETLKIVIIGESGVGKTSIISQFIDQIFQKDQQSTIGGTFSTKTIKCGNGKILKLEIWDTAGQERYRSVTKMFYKDANAAILVYDITNKFSFEELQNYWMEQVKESSPKNTILAVVANKSDLIEYEQVDEEVARQFAKDNNAFFSVTSAKDTAQVDSLFLEIAKKYSGSDTALTLEEKDEEEEYRKIRKESVKITKETQVKSGGKKKGCC
jgi:small GTP-binding protein